MRGYLKPISLFCIHKTILRMNLFSLSYQLVKETENENISIVKPLIDFLYLNGCKDFKSYVSRTINFHSNKDTTALSELIRNEWADRIYFQVCMVSKENNLHQIHSTYKPAYFKSFQEMAQEIIENYNS